MKRVDRKTDGGGVLIAYKKCLKKLVLVVREEREDEEMLWLKLDNGKVKMRIGIVYMPQENETRKEVIQGIYKKIEEEVDKGIANGEKVIIMGDMNCKVGSIIKGNTDEVSKGGKILLELCKKMDLAVINSQEICKGAWTRIQKEKKSILDYIITNKQDVPLISSMLIDEDKVGTPHWINEEKEVVYTDHCVMTMEMKIDMKGKNKTVSKYMSKDGYERFGTEIKEQQISEILDPDDFDRTYQEWSDKVIKVADECSTRKRKSRGWKANRKLLKVKKQITKKLKNQGLSKEEIRLLKVEKNLVEEFLYEEKSKKNYEEVNNVVQKIKSEGGVNSTAFWELKRRIEGRIDEVAHIVEDENGEKLEDKQQILDRYRQYFQNLLETQKGATEVEKETEEIVELTMATLQLLDRSEEIEKIPGETLEKIVTSLKKRKSKDLSDWKNEYILSGGTEMMRSLEIIMEHVDITHETPSDWEKMKIKAIHKQGPKPKMENKRGLFVTNLVSKVYEKIIKERNRERAKVSPMQTGGIEGKSAIDNTMIMLAVAERNKYLNKPTFLTFADVKKCFDKLWLEDGVRELWRNGMSTRDCVAVKKMNEVAEAIVATPVGNTEPLKLENTVRQGTVNGPPICAAVMDTINSIGYDTITHYGPYLIIKTLAYVDDLGSGGSVETANKTIMNCNVMEERKKIEFNTKKGKSAILIMNWKDGDGVVTAIVKNGEFEEVYEYKYLGIWIDVTGRYKINIMKKKQKLPYMTSSIKRMASTYKMGNLSTHARMNLMNIILIPSFIYNAEAFPTFTNEEIKLLEATQAQMLKDLLQLPVSTPYFPLLMETGMWTMEARIHYKKLMLYHNILNSPDDRLLKNLIMEQAKGSRSGTWHHGITELLKKYRIELSTETPKSTWKKHVKERINEEVEKNIRNNCQTTTKGRTVADDEYQMKEYLKHVSSSSSSS